jgi:heme exporter protein A
MLEAVNLGCARGERRLFSNLNFSVTPGTLLQLAGPNGSGKTSLLRMLCGLLAPEEGEIRWRGENIRSLGEEYFSDLIYIGHRNGLKEELSSLENLTISTGLAGREATHDEARGILGKMGLEGRENLPARLLSEGQRRRSALARLLSSSTSLWLLDEVLTSLDEAAVVLMKSLMEDHLGSGGMAIVATHQDLNLSSGKFERLELAARVPGGAAPLGWAS